MFLPFIGTALDKILPRVLKDKDKVFQVKAEIEKEISSQEFEIKKSIIQEASANIRAEAQGESWLQQSWRPIAMLWVLGMMSVYMLCLLYDPVKPIVISVVKEVKGNNSAIFSYLTGS